MNSVKLILLLLSLDVLLSAAAHADVSVIAYTRFVADGAEIWLVNDDGSNNVRVGPGADASWAPDAKRLAFVQDVKGNSDIYFMNVDGSNVTRLTTDPAGEHSPTWSPDGSMIAFNSDRSGSDQIWRSNVEAGNWGFNLTQLTQDTSHNRVNNFISWSPDGRWLAFEADRDRDDPEIYLASSVDGTYQQRLTFTRALDEVPSWSPDSQQILFSSDMHDEPQSGTYDIYVMNADGSNLRRLTDTPGMASYPTMSSDGNRIAYSYQESGDSSPQIWVMNSDGSDQRLLLDDGGIPRYAPN